MNLLEIFKNQDGTNLEYFESQIVEAILHVCRKHEDNLKDYFLIIDKEMNTVRIIYKKRDIHYSIDFYFNKNKLKKGVYLIKYKSMLGPMAEPDNENYKIHRNNVIFKYLNCDVKYISINFESLVLIVESIRSDYYTREYQ